MSDKSHLFEYVKIGARALGKDRLTKPTMQRLPRRIKGEKPAIWCLNRETRNECHLRYCSRIARLVADRYGIDPKDGEYLFVSTLQGNAGHVKSKGRSFTIQVDKQYKDDAERVAAILAHEFAHVFLDRRGNRLTPELRNEQLTDTVAILAGFGPIMCRAQLRKYQYGDVIHTSTIGYLSRTELEWLTRLQGKIASGKPRYILRRLNPAEQEYIQCVGCTSKLRLIKKTGRFLVTCPVCASNLSVRLKIPVSTCDNDTPK